MVVVKIRFLLSFICSTASPAVPVFLSHASRRKSVVMSNPLLSSPLCVISKGQKFKWTMLFWSLLLSLLLLLVLIASVKSVHVVTGMQFVTFIAAVDVAAVSDSSSERVLFMLMMLLCCVCMVVLRCCCALLCAFFYFCVL